MEKENLLVFSKTIKDLCLVKPLVFSMSAYQNGYTYVKFF